MRRCSFTKTIKKNFVAGTVTVGFTAVADRFLRHLASASKILDYGCGSGRDAKYFLQKGFHVEALDGSLALCQFASEYTGLTVQCMRFEELDKFERYQGIWACASILHASKKEPREIFRIMIRALKPDGISLISPRRPFPFSWCNSLN